MGSSSEMRVALTTENFEGTVGFYRDVLGLATEQEWSNPDGRGVVLAVPRATIEIVDWRQALFIDSIEAGRRVSGRVRLAFQLTDVDEAVRKAKLAGGQLVRGPVQTPWKHRNARLIGPDGLQLTFFQVP